MRRKEIGIAIVFKENGLLALSSDSEFYITNGSVQIARNGRIFAGHRLLHTLHGLVELGLPSALLRSLSYQD